MLTNYLDPYLNDSTPTKDEEPISFASACPNNVLICRPNGCGQNPIVASSWKRLAFAVKRPLEKAVTP